MVSPVEWVIQGDSLSESTAFKWIYVLLCKLEKIMLFSQGSHSYLSSSFFFSSPTALSLFYTCWQRFSLSFNFCVQMECRVYLLFYCVIFFFVQWDLEKVTFIPGEEEEGTLVGSQSTAFGWLKMKICVRWGWGSTY